MSRPKYHAKFYFNNILQENPIFYDEDSNIIKDPEFFKEEDTKGASSLTPRESITPHFKFPIYGSNGRVIKTDFKEVRLQPLPSNANGLPKFNLEPMRLSDEDNNNSTTTISVTNRHLHMKDPNVEEVRNYLRKKYGKTVNSPFLTNTDIRQINTSAGVITLIQNKDALDKLKSYLDNTYIPFLRKYYEHEHKKEGQILKNLNKMTTRNYTESYFELIFQDFLPFVKQFPNLGLHKADVYSNLEAVQAISENIPRDYHLFLKTQEAFTENTRTLFEEIKKEINVKEGIVPVEKKFKLGVVPGMGGKRSVRNKKKGQKRRKTRRSQ